MNSSRTQRGVRSSADSSRSGKEARDHNVAPRPDRLDVKNGGVGSIVVTRCNSSKTDPEDDESERISAQSEDVRSALPTRATRYTMNDDCSAFFNPRAAAAVCAISHKV